MRKIFVLLMLAFAGHLGAQTYEYQPAFGNLGYYPTAQAACDAARSSNNASCPGSASYRVDGVVADSQGASCYISAVANCSPPFNPSSTDFLWILLNKRIKTTPEPNPDLCASPGGTKTIENLSAGWARSGVPDALDHVGTLFSPYTPTTQGGGVPLVCINKCIRKATNVVRAGRSKEPSPNGLFRLSIDVEYTVQGTPQIGETCPTQQLNTQPFIDASNPNMPPLTCAGVVGQVNGKPVCAPDGSTNTIPAPQGEPLPGNEISMNPQAGTMPSTGEGSGTTGAGRTPTAGNGTAFGGPASAAGSGTAPTGTTPKPGEGEEQQACGAPGQPQCKIDETGTPTDKSLTADIPKLKGEADAGRSKIAGTQDKGFLSTYTALFDAPPFVACTPFDLPNNYGSLDICGHGDTFRAVAAVLWALGGFWWSFSLIREVF